MVREVFPSPPARPQATIAHLLEAGCPRDSNHVQGSCAGYNCRVNLRSFPICLCRFPRGSAGLSVCLAVLFRLHAVFSLISARCLLLIIRSVYLSVCLSVVLFVCLSVARSVCLLAGHLVGRSVCRLIDQIVVVVPICPCPYFLVPMSLSLRPCPYVLVPMSLSLCPCPFVLSLSPFLMSLPLCPCPYGTVHKARHAIVDQF